MKKLFAILLIAFFVVGLSSCAEEPLDTQPIIPEVSQDAIDRLQDQKSAVGKRKTAKHSHNTRTRKAILEAASSRK